MTHRRRVSMFAATAAAFAVSALAVTTLNDADAASASGAVRSGRTALHLNFTGCDRCSIQLYQALRNQDTPLWHSRRQKVGSDHVATFEVATGFTHGMSFEVRAPWAKGTHAVPNAVTRYAGHEAGSAISLAEARRSGRAAGCWSGTTQSTKDLSFRVDRVRTESGSGTKVVTPLVYAPHSMSSWRPFVKTFHGTIGNQDAFYCTPPAS